MDELIEVQHFDTPGEALAAGFGVYVGPSMYAKDYLKTEPRGPWIEGVNYIVGQYVEGDVARSPAAIWWERICTFRWNVPTQERVRWHCTGTNSGT